MTKIDFWRLGYVAEYLCDLVKEDKGHSQRSIALMHHWNETFNQEQWNRLVSKVAFHKLSFRVPKEVKMNKNNYYNHILNGFREG